MRLIFRILGTGLFIWGVFLLGADLWNGRGFQGTKFGQVWFDLHPTSLQLLQPALERHVAVFLWNPVMTTILQTAGWIVIGGLGLLILLLTSRRNHK